MDPLTVLGAELRRARLVATRRLTQEAVADGLGLSRKTWSAYEAGRVEPPALVLLRAAGLLRLDLNQLAKVTGKCRVAR